MSAADKKTPTMTLTICGPSQTRNETRHVRLAMSLAWIAHERGVQMDYLREAEALIEALAVVQP